jgi:hypothetical protein
MMLRKLILGAVLAAAATSAAAQPPRYDPRYDPRDEDIARRLPPPAEIARSGDRLHRVLDALMDIRVGPLIDAIDPAARYDRYRPETLGDVASRDDPYARARLHDEVDRTTAGLGAATREVTVLAPALRRSLEDAVRRVDGAMRGDPNGAAWRR